MRGDKVERFDTFTVLIAKISRKIRKIKTQEMAKYNLKSPHVSCLYYLHKYGSMSAKELCDMCDEDKASISRSLDYLEKNGYLFCDSTAKKRYKSLLILTTKGAEIAAFLVERIDSVLDVVAIGVSEEDRATLYSSLSLIDENLSVVCNSYDSKDKK
jgi:DNA-binding MarR family transcriptional regulator